MDSDKDASIETRLIEPCLEIYKKQAFARGLLYDDDRMERYILDCRKHLCESNKLILPRIVIVVSTKCNLSCKNCSNLMPMYKKPYDIPANEIIKDIEQLLRFVDEIVEIEVIGGEPFIYDQLDKVLGYLINNSKIDYIDITTNGLRIPDNKVLTLLSNEKIKVNISDYGYIKAAVNFISELEKRNIRLTCHSSMQWIDCGGIESRGRDLSMLTEMYLKCSSGKVCKTVLKGRLFPCARAAHLYDLEYVKEIDCLNLYHVISSIEICDFYTRSFSIACNYCDFTNIPSKHIEPAIQINTGGHNKSDYTVMKRGDVINMEKGKEWLEAQVRYKDERINELENWIKELEKGKEWLETQVQYKDARINELVDWANSLERNKRD